MVLCPSAEGHCSSQLSDGLQTRSSLFYEMALAPLLIDPDQSAAFGGGAERQWQTTFPARPGCRKTAYPR
jgi:hypothetical protein